MGDEEARQSSSTHVLTNPNPGDEELSGLCWLNNMHKMYLFYDISWAKATWLHNVWPEMNWKAILDAASKIKNMLDYWLIWWRCSKLDAWLLSKGLDSSKNRCIRFLLKAYFHSIKPGPWGGSLFWCTFCAGWKVGSNNLAMTPVPQRRWKKLDLVCVL